MILFCSPLLLGLSYLFMQNYGFLLKLFTNIAFVSYVCFLISPVGIRRLVSVVVSVLDYVTYFVAVRC